MRGFARRFGILFGRARRVVRCDVALGGGSGQGDIDIARSQMARFFPVKIPGGRDAGMVSQSLEPVNFSELEKKERVD